MKSGFSACTVVKSSRYISDNLTEKTVAAAHVVAAVHVED
jgi:hypothetical protein